MTRRLLTLCVTILAFCSTVTSKAENPKPFVIPELRSWNGGEGALSIGNVTKVFYTDASLSIAAEEFADDYTEPNKIYIILGRTINSREVIVCIFNKFFKIICGKAYTECTLVSLGKAR